MRVPFVKMHGLGNDFVVVREPVPDPARIADRRTGVGCDQVILLQGDRATFWNADGSRAGACGNGTRCVAALCLDERGGDAATIRTDAGELRAWRERDGRITADMGPVGTGWADVPLAEACDTLHVPVSSGDLSDGVACSIGNPHVTFFVPDAGAFDMAHAARLETHRMFPGRVNVGVASLDAAARVLRLRVWERGVGLTPACGSGACAAAVALARRGLWDRSVTVRLDGGDLDVVWRDGDGHVLQTGPAVTVFEGVIEL